MALLQRQLKSKLYEIYQNSSLPATAPLYYVKIPQGITQEDYPVVVYQIISAIPEFNLGSFSPARESNLVQFKIVSNKDSSKETEDIAETLVGLYDGATFVLTGWSVVEMSRGRNIGPWKDDVGVWNFDITYRLLCQK